MFEPKSQNHHPTKKKRNESSSFFFSSRSFFPRHKRRRRRRLTFDQREMLNKEVRNEFDEIVVYFVRLLNLLIFIVGNSLNIFNLLTLKTKKYRGNSCSFYLFVSTFFDSFYLLISIGTRFINGFDPNLSLIYCRCRMYLVIVCPFISTCFILLGSIDRCLSSSYSHHWRHFSRIPFAHRLTMFTLIFLFLSMIHIFFFFDVEFIDNHLICVPHRGIYRTFFALFIILTSPFLLYLLMFLSNLSTLKRYQQLKKRFELQRRNHCHRTSRIDHQLILLIFLQVGLGMFFTFFRLIYLFINLWKNSSMKKSSEYLRLESLIDQLTLIIFYLNFSKSFPINFFASSLYRHVFYQNLQRIFLHFRRKLRLTSD